MNASTQRSIDAFSAFCDLIKSVTKDGCDEQNSKQLYVLEEELLQANIASLVSLPSLPIEERHALQAAASELASALDALVKSLETGTTKVRFGDRNMSKKLSAYYRKVSKILTHMATRVEPGTNSYTS